MCFYRILNKACKQLPERIHAFVYVVVHPVPKELEKETEERIAAYARYFVQPRIRGGAVLLRGGEKRAMTLYLKNTDAQERELLLRGCLINYYAAKNEERHG